MPCSLHQRLRNSTNMSRRPVGSLAPAPPCNTDPPKRKAAVLMARCCLQPCFATMYTAICPEARPVFSAPTLYQSTHMCCHGFCGPRNSVIEFFRCDKFSSVRCPEELFRQMLCSQFNLLYHGSHQLKETSCKPPLNLGLSRAGLEASKLYVG